MKNVVKVKRCFASKDLNKYIHLMFHEFVKISKKKLISLSCYLCKERSILKSFSPIMDLPHRVYIFYLVIDISNIQIW